MTLLDLLKTYNHTAEVRIHFGPNDHYFDIRADQRKAFTEWLDWSGTYDSVTTYYQDDVESFNVQDITYTEETILGEKIERIKKVLFVKMK